MKRCAQCGVSKPVEDFPKNASRSTGHGAACKVCHTATQTARYEHNKERMRDRARERTFGLQPGEYAKLHELQNGLCAICGRPEATPYGDRVRALAVDHNHETGQRRKLLCRECNQGLGLFGDDPNRLLQAAAYLIQHEVLTFVA